MDTYCVRKIAVETDHNCGNGGETITFKNVALKKLFEFDYGKVLNDTASNRDFMLKIIPSTIQNDRYLGLFYDPAAILNFQTSRQLHLLKLGFNYDPVSPPTEDDADFTGNSESYRHRSQRIAEFYQLLRDAHYSTDKLHCSIPANPDSDSLKVTLRSYQTRALRWLLHRELSKEMLPHGFITIRSSNLPETKFLLQPDYLKLIVDCEPNDISLPTGGILADEMGLGKTIEMLALFVLNKRNLPTPESTEIADYTIESKRQKLEISCVCGKSTQELSIECRLCRKAQHRRCTRKYSKKHHNEDDYLCPTCWDQQPLIQSGGTIIVAPATIKLQWSSEIATHSENIRVFIYDGVLTTGWISPVELAEYDIVLTDYNVLTREHDFAADNDTNLQLRNKRRYIRRLSPLNMIDWWRAVLDEAQMVESGVTKSAKMLKKLVAVHRWAVTGTPIQKSIDDIRGLLEFLDIPPYQDAHTWKILSAKFVRGNQKPLLDVLSKVMWRTCKATVLDELGIPPQSEKVHYVVMSDVQRLFYRGQHSLCSWAFNEKIRKLSSSMELSEIDPRTLNKILEPLRKLRQDCTVPVIFKKMEQSRIKKCLRPDELVTHMKTTNENECKNHLRSMVSSINGIAALHILRCEFNEAAELYKSVLELAKKYTGTICVDTLLQIHALHNLTDIYSIDPTIPCLDLETINAHRNECDTLEWKYMSMYNDNLKKAEKSFLLARNAYKEIDGKLPDQRGLCWQDLLFTLKMSDLAPAFLERVNEENLVKQKSLIYFRSTEGISYFLNNWFNKLFEARQKVVDEFKKFKPYMANIKPKNQLTKQAKDIVDEFVKSTFTCHLNELQSTKKKKKHDRKKIVCELCKAKKLLDLYECTIFSKSYHEKKQNAEGTWNPTEQENICKALLRFAKSCQINDDNVRECGEFLKLLECMKTEYKEYVKLWIEIEYTVKANDELVMCKMRLQSCDIDDIDERTNYQILLGEIDGSMEAMKDQQNMNEIEFKKKLSRLKYLRHLESNVDPEICPICKCQPDLKYSMLQCGHHMCELCLIGMKSFQKSILTCSVCRFRQKYEDVYYVTRKSDEIDEIEIKGNYSAKVEEVVREVLKLKQQDEDVKIIIFSYWDVILGVIAQALITNDVKIAFNKCAKKSITSFKSFNSDITCLLLMLSQGSKGLNLTEATHVFLVEPILNPGEEQQAIGRVHRIGQTKPTTVHRFVMKETIEEQIFNAIANDGQDKWNHKEITISNLRDLFSLD